MRGRRTISSTGFVTIECEGSRPNSALRRRLERILDGEKEVRVEFAAPAKETPYATIVSTSYVPGAFSVRFLTNKPHPDRDSLFVLLFDGTMRYYASMQFRTFDEVLANIEAKLGLQNP